MALKLKLSSTVSVISTEVLWGAVITGGSFSFLQPARMIVNKAIIVKYFFMINVYWFYNFFLFTFCGKSMAGIIQDG
ncbi:MAG TPA: hypothetical protein DCY25_09575 [Bacteroidales bacterium]|nr:hypothetical protein [Bacteroidales bacterium]